jgi:membrane fusion protein, copper/silver efflux system
MRQEIAATTMQELRGLLLRWAFVLAALGVFAVWATWRLATAAERLPSAGTPAAPTSGHEQGHQHARAAGPRGAEQAWYRCTMPACGDQGSSVKGSRCPVCGMKRERVDTGGGDAGDYEITLSERARRLAEVETGPAAERLLFKRLRTVGRVGYDETRYKLVSAWVGGRIDQLFADFTGMTVSQGDHLVAIYSPELLSAQEEYLQSLRATRGRDDAQSTVARRSGAQVLAAARRKLELLGITAAQIDAVEQSGQPQTHLVVHAPIGGTIVKKQAIEGMYVQTGDVLYTIADLTHLWLLVDLYEADLPWVKPFQDVRVTTRSLPGEVFTGQIVFIEPKLDPQTRTVQVRIHVENPALRLKPDMWVTARIDAGLARGGRGAVPAPDGDFACPMHTWETADTPAACPVCEMDMVRLEDLPQYTPPTNPVPVLSVPRGAVMQTGERALVYVETAPGTYRGVEVTVGPLARAADGREFYPILSGLSGGEAVVTRGNFAIDSQMQLAGKPSLFTARGLADAESVARTDLTDEAELVHPTTEPPAITQTHCPVMGSAINPEVFIEYKGVKVYFCCWGCDDKFLNEPEKYIPKLPASVQQRIRAADAPESPAPAAAAEIEQTTCPVMDGEIDPTVHTDYHGVRVYFCCPPCIPTFEADPQQYIAELPVAIQERIARATAEEADGD